MTKHSTGAENSPKKETVSSAEGLSRLYLEALRVGDGGRAYRIATRALQEGMDIPGLYQRVVAPAMHEVGALWERGALTVADEHLATELTNRVLSALRPPFRAEMGEAGAFPRSRAVMAAVEGEQHALGLRMASDILEEEGFQTIYLGADVPTNALLQAVRSFSPDLLVLTATMSVLAPRLEEVSAAVREAHPRVELLVGGQAAPLRVAGGTLVQSFELLPERVPPGPQV